MRSILSVLLFFASVQVAVAGLWEDIRFVNIPAGSFEMGSTRHYSDEMPIHTVHVKGFLMMDHELTVKEAKSLVKLYPGLITRKLTSPVSEFITDEQTGESTVLYRDDDQLPVTLTYAEAEAIAAKISKTAGKTVRLPTEPEWEYAARGGLKQKQYPWGNPQEKFRGKKIQLLVDHITGKDDGHHCNFGMPVGPVRSMSPSNAYGLYDMAGNAWEWTSSVYRAYPYRLPKRGRVKKSSDDMIVIRGGGHAQESCDVRVAFRGYANLDSQYGVRFITER